MLNGRQRRGLFAVPVNVYLLIALVVAAAVIHVTWLPRLPVRPDLMLVLVVAWSLLRGVEEGLLWAFIGGVLLDLLSVGPFGGFTVFTSKIAWRSPVTPVSIVMSIGKA